jgi:transposase
MQIDAFTMILATIPQVHLGGAIVLPEATEYLPPDARDLEIFEATVAEDHYLRRVRAIIDFERFRADLLSCYREGLGRPATEPLLLLKMEFLQYHYNLSDRRVLEQTRCNMAFRYFLDLSLKSPLPHHTLFTKFRNRLGFEKHQQIFEDVVAQARAHGLVKDRLRLKDATHVIANIAIPSAVRLVAQTRQQLLKALRPYQPERVVLAEERAAAIHTTTADLSGEERLLQRVNHLRSIVTQVEEDIAAGSLSPTTEPGWQALQEALQLAHKVLADREDPKSKDRLVNVHDPDARWGYHHMHYVGYLLDVTEDADSGLITALNVLPANGDEARDATTLIEQEERAHGNDVEILSMDGAGCRGELLRQWTDPQGLNLEVIVPPRPEPAPTEYFAAEQFTRTADGEAMICPAGQTSRQRTRNRHDSGWMFRFTRGVCAACPLLGQCMPKLPRINGRQVSTNDYEAEYQAVRAKVQTPAYKTIRRQHRRIERKLGELVRWHALRRARYRGQPRVLIQSFLTALVVNIKCVVRALTRPAVRAEGLASP